MKTMEDHGKQLVEYNEVAKRGFSINRDSTPNEEQKKYLMILLWKRLLNLEIYKKELILII